MDENQVCKHIPHTLVDCGVQFEWRDARKAVEGQEHESLVQSLKDCLDLRIERSEITNDRRGTCNAKAAYQQLDCQML